MILQSMPIIIPVDYGNSGPMTEEDSKMLIGVWIVLNMLWISGRIMTLIRWVIYSRRFRDTWRSKRNLWEYRMEIADGMLMIVGDGFMLLMWIGIALFASGSFIGKFL